LRAAMMAPSLQMFMMSAPLKPGVKADSFLAYSSLVSDSSVLIFYRWTLKISDRSWIVGSVTSTCLSNLPGRNRALSRLSALLVAARTITEASVWKPSISTRS
jgi:hypothetical protein